MITTAEKTLKLTLKYKWYDMIESGVKPEEYRSIKETIVSLLFDWKASGLTRKTFTDYIQKENSAFWIYLKDFTHVEFYRGYSRNRKSMILEIDEIDIGKAVPEWSDNWQGDVFIIKLNGR